MILPVVVYGCETWYVTLAENVCDQVAKENTWISDGEKKRKRLEKIT